MKHAVILVCLAAAAVAYPLQSSEFVPVARPEGRHTGRARQPLPWTRQTPQPVPVWAILGGLTPEDQANAAISLDLGTASPDALREARAVEDLWNSGERPAALARLRDIGKYHDPTDINVGMSWREPIPTTLTTGWGPNVRVGNRDSVFEIEFDHHNRTGYLFLTSARDSGAMSVVNVYRSTDGGESWAETFNLAVSQGYINSIGAVANTNNLYVGYTRRPNQSMARVMCIACSTGGQVRFPNDSLYRTMFAADTTDSIQELVMTSASDQNELRIYAFGCTKGRKLELGWTDSLAVTWNEYNTNVSWCDGGLACAYNAFFGSTDKRFLWASWIYERTDTLWNVGVCYLDTAAAHSFYINPAFENTYTMTSQAAWKDTILISYARQAGTERYLSLFVTYNAGTDWYYSHFPDTLTVREWPDVTGRHGDGFALAARQYSGSEERDLIYSHAGYSGSGWTAPLDVSDYRPALYSPEVEWVAPDVYACAYVKWYDDPDAYSIWFNRSDWTGVEDVGLHHPKFGLEVSIGRDKAELRFQNPRHGPVSVRVYDAAGRLVSCETRTFVAGEQVFQVKARSSGVHFAVIDIDGETETTRLTFAR
jgi:hypothetical protein